MLLEYITEAMRIAKYEILTDDNSFYGELPGFDGVYANAKTLVDCQQQLQEVLEKWIFFRLSKNLPIPRINKYELKIRKMAA
jgi:predicted RNase H-like HicB family nuclease